MHDYMRWKGRAEKHLLLSCWTGEQHRSPNTNTGQLHWIQTQLGQSWPATFGCFVVCCKEDTQNRWARMHVDFTEEKKFQEWNKKKTLKGINKVLCHFIIPVSSKFFEFLEIFWHWLINITHILNDLKQNCCLLICYTIQKKNEQTANETLISSFVVVKHKLFIYLY